MNDYNVTLGRKLVILTITYTIFTQIVYLYSLFNEFGEEAIHPQNVLPLLFRVGLPILFCYLLFIGHKWVRWVLAILLMFSGLYYIYLILIANGIIHLHHYFFCLANISISLLLFLSRNIKNYLQFKDDEFMSRTD
jgi:hypothetical protein